IAHDLEAAANARLSPDRLRADDMPLAEERLRLEERLRTSLARESQALAGDSGTGARSLEIDHLIDCWDEFEFELLRDGLRDVVAKVIASEDAVRIILRP